MSNGERSKSPRAHTYTFKDFFAAKNAASKKSRPDQRTSTLPASASPLLAVVAQVKRRAPAPSGRGDTTAGSALAHSSSPNARSVRSAGGVLSPARKRPRDETACPRPAGGAASANRTTGCLTGGGAVAALGSAAVAATYPVHPNSSDSDSQSGARAAKLLKPDEQRLIADKRARKRKTDLLRQATSGLGAARVGAPIGAARIGSGSLAQSRPASARSFEDDETQLHTSDDLSDDENRASESRASTEDLSRDQAVRAAGRLREQNAPRQAAQSSLDCPATKRPEAEHPTASIASRPAATPVQAAQPVGENHAFYLNARRSAPNGEFISRMHAEWASQYGKLEKHHSYIQWLFPVFENAGVNRKAHPLAKLEAKAMREDPIIARRIVTSYRMMLRFYGFTLVNEATGEVRRSEAWQPRFRNFNAHTHNNLRISRILVSLGELGFRRYKAPLLEALRVEIFDNNQLKACRKSFVDFWQGLVTDEGEPWYVKKTRETSDADRTESIFFAPSNCYANDHKSSPASSTKRRSSSTPAQPPPSAAAAAAAAAVGDRRAALSTQEARVLPVPSSEGWKTAAAAVD